MKGLPMKSLRQLRLMPWCYLLLASAAAADPWQALHGLEVPSTMRRVTYGWVFDDFDAGADPVLARPLTASTVWANGVVDGQTPLIRTGLDLPMGKALLTTRLVAGQHKRAGLDSRLIAEESDLNADGFADQLRWQRSVSGLAQASQEGQLGARLGLRWPNFGLASSYTRLRQRQFPTAAAFAFPDTTAAIGATAEAISLFDLQSGDLLSARVSGSRLLIEQKQHGLGFDLGGRLKSVAAAIGLGLIWEDALDSVTANSSIQVKNIALQQLAARNQRQQLRSLLMALRFDGQHEVERGRNLVWTAGLSVQKPLAPKWSGIERLALYDKDANDPLISWNREQVLQSYDRSRLNGHLGLGLSDEGPLFRYGFGVDWRALSDKANTAFQDQLIYRINDPGIAGQAPVVQLSATGSGDWVIDQKQTTYEYGIGGGGRYAVNSYLGLMMGSRVGYRQSYERQKQTLVATTPISGDKITNGAVVDPLEIPYANFDIPDEILREFSETFIDLNLGFTFHINRADLTTLFTLDDASDLAVIVEGVWRW